MKGTEIMKFTLSCNTRFNYAQRLKPSSKIRLINILLFKNDCIVYRKETSKKKYVKSQS